MKYLCNKNKGADQLRGYSAADLRLCFRICKMFGFLMTRLVSLIRAHFNVSKKISMCTLHVENPSNSVSVQAVQKNTQNN